MLNSKAKNPDPKSIWNRCDGAVEGLLAPLATAIIFVLFIALMYKFGYYTRDRILEASIIALVGVVSTYNYVLAEERIEHAVREVNTWGLPTQLSKSEFRNSLFMLCNIIFFALAVLSLTLKGHPDFYLASIFLVFFTFAASNLWQSRTLKAQLLKDKSFATTAGPAPINNAGGIPPAKSAIPHHTGALMIDAMKWLGSENGPSMVGYCVLVIISVVAARSGDVKYIEVFAAGAATFHLAVSVANFLIGLISSPFKQAILHVDWRHPIARAAGKTVLKDVTDVTTACLRWWVYCWILSFVGVVAALVCGHEKALVDWLR